MLFVNTDKKMGNNQSASVTIVSMLFSLFAILLAGLTVLTHLSQVLHISFRSYAIIAVGICVLLFLYWVTVFRKQITRVEIRDTKSLLFLLGLGIISGIVARLVSSLNPDDYYYIPNAVFYAQHPEQAMGFQVYYLYSNTDPFVSIFWATSSAYEYILAIAAYFFHFDFLAVYYQAGAVVTGFLIPFAIFLILVNFSDDTLSAVVGAMVAVGIVMLLGETEKTIGNLFFVRAHQGKAIILSIWLPVFIAFTISFFRQHTLWNWVVLFCIAILSVGLTSSAVILLVPLSAILALANWLGENQKLKEIKPYLVYFMAMGYEVLYALYNYKYATTYLNMKSPANWGWPKDFWGHLYFFINPQDPVTPIAVIVFSIACIFLVPKHQRKFLLIWIASLVVLFLNPLVAPLIIKYMTSPNIYWRMFYTLPFPLVCGLFAMAAHGKLQARMGQKSYISISLIFIFLAGLNFVLPSSVLTYVGNPYITQDFSLESRIAEIAPPGVMLAPPEIAGKVSMIESAHPQMRIREIAERVWLYSQERKEEAEMRIEASNFCDSGNAEKKQYFLDLLTQYGKDLRSVVMIDDVFGQNPGLENFLAENGFTHYKALEGYVVIWR